MVVQYGFACKLFVSGAWSMSWHRNSMNKNNDIHKEFVNHPELKMFPNKNITTANFRK